MFCLRTRILAVIAVTILTVALAVTIRPDRVLPSAAALYALVIIVGVLPYLHYLRHDDTPFPLLPAVGGAYAIFFGFSAFLGLTPQASDDLLIRTEYLEAKPALLALIGLTLMLGAAYLVQRMLAPRVSRLRFIPPSAERHQIILLTILAVINILYFLIPQLKSIPSFDQFAKLAGFVGFGGLSIAIFTSKVSKIAAASMAVLFIIRILLGSETAAVGEVIYLMAFIVLLHMHRHKVITLLAVVIVSAIAAYSYGPIHMYRSLIGNPARSPSTTVEKAWLLTHCFTDPRSVGININQNDWSIGRRIAHAELFADVVADTPAKVPYWGGHSYSNLFLNVIPRALWPEKPTEKYGNEFGRRYAFVKNDNYDTAINIPWLVESYANFGIPGILIIMPLIGVLIGAMNATFNKTWPSISMNACAHALLFYFVNQDSNLSVSIGNIPIIAIAIFLYFNVSAIILSRIESFRRDIT